MLAICHFFICATSHRKASNSTEAVFCHVPPNSIAVKHVESDPLLCDCLLLRWDSTVDSLDNDTGDLVRVTVRGWSSVLKVALALPCARSWNAD